MWNRRWSTLRHTLGFIRHVYKLFQDQSLESPGFRCCKYRHGRPGKSSGVKLGCTAWAVTSATSDVKTSFAVFCAYQDYLDVTAPMQRFHIPQVHQRSLSQSTVIHFADAAQPVQAGYCQRHWHFRKAIHALRLSLANCMILLPLTSISNSSQLLFAWVYHSLRKNKNPGFGTLSQAPAPSAACSIWEGTGSHLQ